MRNEDNLRECKSCGNYPGCGRLVDKTDDSVYPLEDTGFRVPKGQTAKPVEVPQLPETDRRLMAGFLPLYYHKDFVGNIAAMDELEASLAFERIQNSRRKATAVHVKLHW